MRRVVAGLGVRGITRDGMRRWGRPALSLLALLFVLMRGTLLGGQEGTSILLAGRVMGVDGKPVVGAVVELHGPAANGVRARTDASGAFEFRTPRQARYDVSADTSDHRHGEVTVDNPGMGLRIVVKAVDSTQPAMEFADKADFTVAGITDWTAVGGHGSDATLRTSEDIARQTAALKGSGSTQGSKVESAGREAALRAAVDAQPENYATDRALGDFYLRSGRYAEASGLLEKASRLHGGAAEDEYAAALACKGEGDFARAREHVMGALRKEDRAEYHALAGELDEKLGDPLAAAREDERAVAREPSEANYFAWGSELLVHRAIWQAAEVFAKGARLHPESQRLKTGWGAALFGGAKYEEAAERLCEASDLDPSNRETYVFLGKVGLASPSPAACVGEKLGRFLKLRPEDSEANYYEGMMALRAGDRVRAGALLRKAVALRPGFAEGYLQLGVLALGARDNAGAEAEFSRAIAADGSLAEAHYRLGVVYERTGRGELAKGEFARHEALVKEQAEAVERERRGVKQFLVVLEGGRAGSARE